MSVQNSNSLETVQCVNVSMPGHKPGQVIEVTRRTAEDYVRLGSLQWLEPGDAAASDQSTLAAEE